MGGTRACLRNPESFSVFFSGSELSYGLRCVVGERGGGGEGGGHGQDQGTVPPPPVSNECLVQRTLPFGPYFFGTKSIGYRV